jgi:hypothetical protein
MPVFTAKIDNVAKWYGNMAEGFKKLFDAGNLEGLKQAKYGGKYEGGLVWKPGFSNGEKIAAYHAQLVAILEQKKAAGVLAGAQLADAALTSKPIPTPAPSPPTKTQPPAGAQGSQSLAGQAQNVPAMPDFNTQLMAGDTGNAKANNNKVLKLKSLAESGDVKGILSLAYGSNTYGKQHVKLANDALAALGSLHTVSMSQKAHSHPALHGGVTAEAVADAANKTNGKAPAKSSAPNDIASEIKTSKQGSQSSGSSWLTLGPGEKVISQGEDLGVKWAQIETPAKGFTAADIPSPPDFFASGTQGPSGKWVSTKEALNAANNATVKAIYDAAIAAKGPTDFSKVMVPEISKDTLLPTGKMVAVTSLPISQIKTYINQIESELASQQKVGLKTLQSGSMTDGYASAATQLAAKYKSVSYDAFKAAERAADFVVLSKDGAKTIPIPQAATMKEMTANSSSRISFKAASESAYNSLSSTEKGAAQAYTGSAYDSWNEALRKGEIESKHFKAAGPMVEAFKKASQSIPAGTILWRGIGVGASTFESVVGGVIQDGSFNSSSYGAYPGGPGYSKGTWMKIFVPSAGTKGFEATGFSNFGSGEREIIIQNGVRYAVLRVTKHKNWTSSDGKSHGPRTIVEVIALPHK